MRESGDHKLVSGVSFPLDAFELEDPNEAITDPAILNPAEIVCKTPWLLKGDLGFAGELHKFHGSYHNTRYAPGGSYYTGTISETGAIKLRFPMSGWHHSMWSVALEVKNYVSANHRHSTFILLLTGYDYATTSAWYDTSARIIGDMRQETLLGPIRWGVDDAGYTCIVIGDETASVWRYLGVNILWASNRFTGAALGGNRYSDFLITLITSTTGYTFTQTVDQPLRANTLFGIKNVAGANYTVLDTDGYSIIRVDTNGSARVVTLPTAFDNAGRFLTILKSDTDVAIVTIDGEGSETIGSSGALYFTLYEAGDYVTLYSTGYVWDVVSSCSINEVYSTSDIAVASAASGTWYNPTGMSVILPYGGEWILEYQCCVDVYQTGCTSVAMQAGLSTNSTGTPTVTESLTYEGALHDSSGAHELVATLHGRMVVRNSGSRTYYLMIRGMSSAGGTLTSLTLRGSCGTTGFFFRRLS